MEINMTLNTIIGQAARGKDYFPRPHITNEIWAKIDTGSNILLVAPRRIGKSSILFNLLDEPRDDRIVIYYTSESVNNENEFYKKLYQHITDQISGVQKYKQKTTVILKDLVSRIESISIKGDVSIGESKVSYFDELLRLLKNIELGNDRIIVLIDEFAQTVENIIQDESERAAIHFLETKRVIRQAPEIHKKLQFIYAGSIGLENVVGRMNGSSLINDLVSIQIPTLAKGEVKDLVGRILDGSGVEFDEGAYEHLLGIIEWWVPFYFQLILDETNKFLVEEGTKRITALILDRSLKNALNQRIYFDQWFTRLRKAYKSEDFSFVKELLNRVSINQTIRSNEIYDMAVKYKIENSFNDLVNALKHDGYINNNDDPKVYRFNSPLLREWWKSNVAN
jgi:hypothetical protein